jgi:hypothetical protein
MWVIAHIDCAFDNLMNTRLSLSAVYSVRFARGSIIKNVSLKIDYEALWLQGVAVAAGQIQETYTSAPATVSALGVNCDSGVLFHGATVGLEYSF